MKKLFVFYLLLTFDALVAQSVAINTDGSPANESAILDLSSTSKGFLLPRMTASQKDAILNPVSGLQVWCTNCGTYGEVQIFNGMSWITGAVGAAGAQGLKGADGLTNSVNGVVQIDGAITLTKENIGLGNVDNTTDIDKPISISLAAALTELQTQISNLQSVNHPKLTTTTPTAITQITASSGGNVISEGPSPSSVTARGICWSTSSGPTIALETTTVNGLGAGTFTSSITGLSASTTYYVRSYATNNFGTGYGIELNFTTPANTPLLTTSAVTAITAATASSGGNISYTGASAVTARGVCWSTSTAPTIDLVTKTVNGTGTGAFTSSLTALNGSTTYYVRAYATNSFGTSYGNEVSFSTLSNIPTLTSTAITAITATTASSGGNISYMGGSAITARGVCWSTSTAPTADLATKTVNGTGTGVFTSAITGLVANTLYYVRAYATNSFGTSYGNEVRFMTSTVVIGTQIWQNKNLDVTAYRDGTPIPEVTDPTTWINLTTGAWCYYSNIAANGTTYGKLYNWYAVAGIHDNDRDTPNKILAPIGTHIPTDTEWTTLTTFLGGESVAGGKMKSTGTTLWLTPNTAATNSSLFAAIPGGYVDYNAESVLIGQIASFWSATEAALSTAYLRTLSNSNASVGRNGSVSKSTGSSVRLIRD